MNKQQYFLPVFLITIFLDQSTKFLATLGGMPISYNSGVSFNVLANGNSKFLSGFLAIVIIFLFLNFKSWWQRNSLAAGLFFGGAIANLYDRILFDSVRDWLWIPFTPIQNNLADWAIFFGLVLAFLPAFLRKLKNN
jgi:lipoprotein signal peptidase